MGKDKKGKSDAKKALKAEKKQKQEKKAEKKAKVKAAKTDGSDVEDVDLDAVLEEYKKQQEQFLKVTETVVDGPPKPRAASCFLASPSNNNQLLLFGGEFSSPKQGTFYHYNDFWRLEPSSREWTRLEPKGKTPPARSGHRMT